MVMINMITYAPSREPLRAQDMGGTGRLSSSHSSIFLALTHSLMLSITIVLVSSSWDWRWRGIGRVEAAFDLDAVRSNLPDADSRQVNFGLMMFWLCCYCDSVCMTMGVPADR